MMFRMAVAMRVTEATVDVTNHSLEAESEILVPQVVMELADRRRMWRIISHLN